MKSHGKRFFQHIMYSPLPCKAVQSLKMSGNQPHGKMGLTRAIIPRMPLVFRAFVYKHKSFGGKMCFEALPDKIFKFHGLFHAVLLEFPV